MESLFSLGEVGSGVSLGFDDYSLISFVVLVDAPQAAERDNDVSASTGSSHKALAFQEPWATLIATGVKRNEYRSRRINTPVRNLVVCASKTAKSFDYVPGLVYGKAVGLVDVIGCDPDGQGGWIWRLENARLVEPFDVHATAGFFYVDDQPSIIEGGPDAYRHSVLPQAERGTSGEINDTLQAVFGNRRVLRRIFGGDVEEWL